MKMHPKPARLAAAVLLALICALPSTADVVTDWNAELLDAIRADRTNPPRATRALAMMNVAMFDAANGIAGEYRPYAVTDAAPAGASQEAAAAAAAHHVLGELYPAFAAAFDQLLADQLAAVADPAARADGRDWGVDVGEQIVALRAGDGADTILPYEAPEGAGWWIRTGPAFAPALLPNWPFVEPWTLTRASQFRQPAPPPLASPEYAAYFDEVRRFGRFDSAERTADQSQIAQFWDDGPGTNTPPGHWNEILQIVVAGMNRSLVDNARLFALHGLSVADAAIVSWDTKFHWDHWRPVTGIRLADTDGNPATAVDAGWASFITNPPFPAYTSGHSTFSSSSARVSALALGTDAIPFTAPSDGTPGVERNFDGLWEAALEAGQSRIYGGIHWQYDNEGGLRSGRALAEHVFHNFLRPLDEAVEVCDEAAGHLCLQGGRFAVQAFWSTGANSGAGTPVLLNDNSGSFWFFDENNTELTVKVLDGCVAFDRFWVFAAGLTNVEVTLRVTDTDTGGVRNYFSPQGPRFEPIQDTGAFATCP